MLLKKYESGWSGGNGPITGLAFKYRVEGLPPGEQADIASFDPIRRRSRWSIFRVKAGGFGPWAGQYTSADEALAALQREVNLPH